MKLRTKIQVFLSVVMVLVIVLVNSAIYILFDTIALNAEKDRLQTQVEGMMEAFATNDELAVEVDQLLRAYIPSNGMIRVINKDNEVIASVSKRAAFYNLPYAFTRGQTHDVISTDGTRHMITSVPIIWHNGETVTLQMTEHLTALEETMAILRIVLLLASVLIILPVVLVGFGLAKLVINPVQQLTRSMTNNPKNGTWKKITIDGRSKDELYQMGMTYNQMIDRLNESIQKQEQFVSDASHELKTPIAVIKSYTQLAMRRGKRQPEVMEESFDVIQSESERMQRLTEQLLSLAKSQQRDNLHIESINIVALTKDVQRSLSVAYKRKIRLDTDEADLFIGADKDKLNQALYILVDNACKYSDDQVEIFIEDQMEEVQIAVKDRGEGIELSEVEHIFDRFYRLDKARSRETGGTGLGLSIAKHIVEAHGGTITVKSKLNEGSTFIIQLPH